MLGLVTAQRTLPIGHDPIATHTLDYIDIIDWHSIDSFSRASDASTAQDLLTPQRRVTEHLRFNMGTIGGDAYYMPSAQPWLGGDPRFVTGGVSGGVTALIVSFLGSKMAT